MSEFHHDTARSSQSAVKDRCRDERKCRAAFSDEEISSETWIPACADLWRRCVYVVARISHWLIRVTVSEFDFQTAKAQNAIEIVIASEAKQSNPCGREERMDSFASLAMTARYASAISGGDAAPGKPPPSPALLWRGRLHGFGRPGMQACLAHLNGIEPGLIILNLPVQILAALVQLAAFVERHNAPRKQGAGGGELESAVDRDRCTRRHVFLLSLCAIEFRFSGLQRRLRGINLPFDKLELCEVGAATGQVPGFEVEAVVKIAQRQQHHPNGR
jgi:hypothetical protein